MQKGVPVEEVMKEQQGRKLVRPENVERELVDYLLVMESSNGCSKDGCKEWLSNNFTSESVDRVWLDHIFRRVKNELSLKRPTGKSYAKAAG